MNNRLNKNTIKPLVKPLVIVLLTISAIYLTGQLWLVEISRRNFFYIFSVAFSDNTPPETSDTKTGIATPYRIVTNLGNKTYALLYNDLQTSAQKAAGDEAVIAVLSKGEFVASKEIDWEEMLKHRSYIYEYMIDMPTDAFVRSLGIKSSGLATRVKQFNSIIIIPSRSAQDSLRVLFTDEQVGQYYEYSVSKSGINEKINSAISNLAESYDGLLYVSSKQSGYSIFEQNTFIPKWLDDKYGYTAIATTNPYSVNDQLLLNTVEKKVDIFFQKPASKWTGTSNGAYTYSDENTVVKYYPFDVLEYSDYNTSGQNISKTAPVVLDADYYAAVSFIKNDDTVTNDYFLADYKVQEENITFYFDYAVNNFPLKLSTSLAAKIEMKHPIEITVENQKVRKYKKLAYSFVTTDIKEYATLDFIGSMNMFAPVENMEKTEINGVSFCYNIDKSRQLLLYWFLDFGGKTYAQSSNTNPD